MLHRVAHRIDGNPSGGTVSPYLVAILAVASLAIFLIVPSLLETPDLEIENSPLHKKCAICGKAATGSRMYHDPKSPTTTEEVFLCPVHLADPPLENPKGRIEQTTTNFFGDSVAVLLVLVMISTTVFIVRRL